MEAKVVEGRIVLDERPAKSEGRIGVSYEGGMKTLEIREGQMAYDLPEGLTAESVTEVSILGDGEQAAPPSGTVAADVTPETVASATEIAVAEVSANADSAAGAVEEKVNE